MTTEEQKPEGALGPDPHPTAQQFAAPQSAAQQPSPQTSPYTVPLPTPPPEPQAVFETGPTTAPATAPSGSPAGAPRKSGPITGSIVWGTLVLVFCAYVASREMGGVIDPLTWIISTFIGLGALLLVVGVTIVLRGSRDRR